ncbi:GNAT family N-acetyltransferase [Oscillochloris sp. ZM17-4]|uniref:GNAT family N-acetyltransferase n=1 Tax=Oscillochloris sp. ZM17-4 TaxID=2866714 RepID=UPI001C72D27B|nr:GNAT family N-acetyltransferase [Oscillochloris sp. ZM17-4]MBX0327709.1 GNAT family N-acetyltransferase [Oscillochloris sp. ZM17-4]
MRLFRKSYDLSRAAARPVHADDLNRVSRLLRDGGRRYYGLSGSELPSLLGAGQGTVLAIGDEIIAVALVSWPADHICWLRSLALAEGVDLRAGIAALLTALHTDLARRQVAAVYYAGDEAADSWILPELLAQGYAQDTEVVVYEKRDLDIPSFGNPDVRVRAATGVDMAEVLRLDYACFEPQWTKDDGIFGPAILSGPLFLIAEIDDQVLGYAYATSHFGGRLIHLVRIAVEPRRQGSQIGVRLLAAVISFASAQGATMITLNTQAYNAHAQRLYRWFGFAPTGERQCVLRRQL